MRFIAGLGVAATAGLLLTAPALAGGHGGGFGGGFGGGGSGFGVPPQVGVGVFGQGSGLVGVQGFNGRNRHGNFMGIYGGGYGGGYSSGGDGYVVPGGNNASVSTYLHYDARPRDGGFYGGGGVFYGDNGYSRVYSTRPGGGDYCPPETVYRPAQHVYDLSAYRAYSRRAPRY